MSDHDELIKRLRRVAADGYTVRGTPLSAILMEEAADAVAALVAENQRLRSTMEMVSGARPLLWQAHARAEAAEAALKEAAQAEREACADIARSFPLHVPLAPGLADGAAIAADQIENAIRARKEDQP